MHRLMLFLFYLISIFGLISCYQASNETTTSKTPQATNKDSIVENLLIAKFDTILVDSFFMSQDTKIMKIYGYRIKNYRGYEEDRYFNILFYITDKLIKKINTFTFHLQ
jgi:hypothetical protein